MSQRSHGSWVMLMNFVLCYVMLCCVVSCRVVSCRVVPCRVVSCHVMSYQLYHIIYHISSHHITSYNIIVCVQAGMARWVFQSKRKTLLVDVWESSLIWPALTSILLWCLVAVWDVKNKEDLIRWYKTCKSGDEIGVTGRLPLNDNIRVSNFWYIHAP